MNDKYVIDDVKPSEVKGDWDMRADPEDAWNDLVSQGYDPDAEYVVGGTGTESLFDPVFEGNLIDCLTRASDLSDQGYFVVMRKEDLDKFKVKVH